MQFSKRLWTSHSRQLGGATCFGGPGCELLKQLPGRSWGEQGTQMEFAQCALACRAVTSYCVCNTRNKAQDEDFTPVHKAVTWLNPLSLHLLTWDDRASRSPLSRLWGCRFFSSRDGFGQVHRGQMDGVWLKLPKPVGIARAAKKHSELALGCVLPPAGCRR